MPMFQWKEVFPAKMALLDNALGYTGIPHVRLHQKYPAFARSPVQDSGPHKKKTRNVTATAQALLPEQGPQPSTIMDSSSTTTSFSLKQSRSFLGNGNASPQATKVFWREIIN